MKIETIVNRCLNPISTFVRSYFEKQNKVNREYAAAYKRCFDGSDEEVERKLAAWDSVHRTTREYLMKGGLRCI